MKKEYIIVHGHRTTVEHEVTIRIEMGWRPSGPVTMGPRLDEFAQAMVRAENALPAIDRIILKLEQVLHDAG